jgi:hypothetical protein
MCYDSRMSAYLLAFVVAFFPQFLRSHHSARETRLVLGDIASTDADALEALTLANIAAMESGFRRDARGKAGERGAFQVMPPAPNYGAAEALRRLRTQGLTHYCGCPVSCPELVAHRQDRAVLYRLGFDPPHVAAAVPSPAALAEIDRADQ